MPKLMVEINGQNVPLEECSWIQRDECGCVVSVVIAVVEGSWTLASAEQAHKHFEPNRRSREKEIRAGLRTELITMTYYDEHLRHSPWECEQHRKPVAA